MLDAIVKRLQAAGAQVEPGFARSDEELSSQFRRLHAEEREWSTVELARFRSSAVSTLEAIRDLCRPFTLPEDYVSFISYVGSVYWQGDAGESFQSFGTGIYSIDALELAVSDYRNHGLLAKGIIPLGRLFQADGAGSDWHILRMITASATAYEVWSIGDVEQPEGFREGLSAMAEVGVENAQGKLISTSIEDWLNMIATLHSRPNDGQ